MTAAPVGVFVFEVIGGFVREGVCGPSCRHIGPVLPLSFLMLSGHGHEADEERRNLERKGNHEPKRQQVGQQLFSNQQAQHFGLF